MAKHPFNENDEEDVALLKKYKEDDALSYKKIAEVWGERDVLKRKVAKENSLNYLMFYGSKLKESEIINEVNNFIHDTL